MREGGLEPAHCTPRGAPPTRTTWKPVDILEAGQIAGTVGEDCITDHHPSL